MPPQPPTFTGPSVELHGMTARERYDDDALAALASVPGLESVLLSKQPISRLPPLPAQLRKLSLGEMALATLAGIEKLVGLTSLELRWLPALDLAQEMPRLAELPDLTDLSLSGIATLPAAIASLPSLVSLQLRLTADADLDATLRVLAPCATLRVLDLSRDVDRLPASIGTLRQLRRLRLHGVASVPDELFDLVDLEVLEIADKRFTTISPRVGKLVKLQALLLDETKLRALPEAVGDLVALRALRIPYRLKKAPASITKLTLDSFFGASEIASTLALNPPQEPVGDHVQIFNADRIPPSLGDPRALEIYVPLERAWPELDALVRLSQITLSVPNLADPLHRLATKAHLRTLQIAGGHATYPAELCALRQVTRMILDWYSFGEAGALTALPDGLGQLDQLVSLELGAGQMTTLPDAIGDLTSLETLELFAPKLETLPAAIGKLAKLHRLVLLKTNALTGLPAELAACSALRSVRIWHTRLEPRDLLVLAKLSSLRELELCNIELAEVEPLLVALAGSALERLALDDYSLKALPGAIGHLAALQRLEMPRGVERVPDELARCTALRFVEFPYNLKSTIKAKLPEGRWRRVERSSRYWYERTD